MYDVKTIDGQAVRIGFRLLVKLSVLMDWQIRNLGYDPISVAVAFLTLENKLESRQ